VATATMRGIDAQDLEQLHRDYFGALREGALRYGEITEREQEDLFLVAGALGIEGGAARDDERPPVQPLPPSPGGLPFKARPSASPARWSVDTRVSR
jgi:hypothetical protein